MQRQDVERLIQDALEAMPHEECRTCDCFHGFLVQLEMDARESVGDVTAPLRVPREKMHGCLGCDPCPPARAFAEYLKRAQESERGTP